MKDSRMPGAGVIVIVILCGLVACAGEVAAQSRGPEPRSVTVPFALDHNRMTVDVALTRPDGSVRTARAWVDTGNDALVLAEALARELGLAIPAEEGLGAVLPDSVVPPLRLAGMPLDLRGVPVHIARGPHALAAIGAEVQLPANALHHHHVVLDYPARSMTIAPPGALRPRGAAVPCRVNAATGLFMIEARLDGEPVWLGVDNGSAGTWVSDTLTRAWKARHPDWPRATGAAGSANFFGFPFETSGTLMRLPELRIGGLRARDVAVLGLDQSLFDWYSRKSAGAVQGFIGANVLRGFRVEIDFPGGMTWWQAGPPAPGGDLDIVGLTLRPEEGGGVTVAGVVLRDGRPLVEGVKAGDRLVTVDGRDASKARMGDVVESLRGAPGAVRTLVLERDGTRLTVPATVARLP